MPIAPPSFGISAWRLLAAGLFGASAVAAGAYSAHGMAESFEPEAVARVVTASQYQLVHALALLALGLFGGGDRGSAGRWLTLSSLCFTAGILLFSGTLYLRSFFDMASVLGLAPVGGALLIIGWLATAVAAVRAFSSTPFLSRTLN